MKRRQFLLSTGLAAAGLAAFPQRWVPAASGKRQKVLYFTRSGGFEHSAVKRNKDELAFSEKVMIEMGRRSGFDVECTKDGTVFDSDLGKYDLLAFYTSGDLTRPDDPKKNVNGGAPPMSAKGKQNLLDAVAAGKGFVGFHSATDSFHSPGAKAGQPVQYDPYIAMIGGEFISHGPQQVAVVRNTSPRFPGMEGVGAELSLNEEWYSMKHFAPDLHVILLQETKGMKSGRNNDYQRPPFPATWARMHQKGRVFFTSFGHRDDIWTNPVVQAIILGGMAWAVGNAQADVTPNISQVAPGANVLPPPPAPKEPAKK